MQHEQQVTSRCIPFIYHEPLAADKLLGFLQGAATFLAMLQSWGACSKVCTFAPIVRFNWDTPSAGGECFAGKHLSLHLGPHGANPEVLFLEGDPVCTMHSLLFLHVRVGD